MNVIFFAERPKSDERNCRRKKEEVRKEMAQRAGGGLRLFCVKEKKANHHQGEEGGAISLV